MSRVSKSGPSSNGHYSLHIKLKDQADDINSIIEALQQPNTFYEVCFWADLRTKHEHLQSLMSAIEKYNKINSIKIDTLKIIVFYDNIADDEEENIGRSLEIFSNLQSPTKYFKFSATYNEDIDNMFQELTTVLRSGTNFNQISIRDLTYDNISLGNGFNQFCDYCCENKQQMLSLRFQDFDLGAKSYKQIIRLIQNSRALTDLEVSSTSILYKHDSSIYDAITNGNFKKLKFTLQSVWELYVNLIKNSQTLEKLTVISEDREIIDKQHTQQLREALKATQSLTSFSLQRSIFLQPDQLLNLIEENESLIRFDCPMGYQAVKSIQNVNKIPSRNRKLQNERVRSMIVLLYNIARSSICNNLSTSALPNDIWPLIMTRVKYPGVTLDFGSIAKSVFKDYSIRRVIV